MGAEQMQSLSQREIFEETILCPVVDEYKKPSEALCGFMALKGHKYDGRLMVVGRAVNSWGDGKSTAELTAKAVRKKFIDQFYFQDTECQMRWVAGEAHYTGGYNTNRSAFWRVVRRVSKRLGVWYDEPEEDWSSHLVWSNLYKIAPHSGGNPSNRLCSIQEKGCIELLNEEIREYAPEKLLFLTGWNWAEAFLKGHDFRLTGTNGFVDAFGTINTSGRNREIPFVVAKHPQGKPESDWVEEVIARFEPAVAQGPI